MLARRRRFRLADTMIVIATAGAGIAWSGSHWVPLFEGLAGRADYSWLPLGWRVWEVTFEGMQAAAGLLAAATLGLLAFRLKPPRPPLRQLARQPGAVALGLAALVMAAGFGLFLSDRITRHVAVWAYVRASLLALIIAPALALAWGALAASGRWDREPDALGVAARLVGVGWIASALVFAGLVLAFPHDPFHLISRLASANP